MIYDSPMKVDEKNPYVEECIKNFMEKGETGAHSPMGGILCHILNHCVREGISFELTYLAGGGYSLKKMEFPKFGGDT